MVDRREIALDDRPINLTQVLKLSGLAGTGGEAKVWIEEGLVRVNGEVESRKRRQMARGDIILLEVEPSPVQLLLK